MKFKSNKGFTLIELLVVIVIIGILATLTTVALSAAKVKARDAKRISDIKQMQTALELYYNEENAYPPTSALVVGQPLFSPTTSKTFMNKIPAGPNTGETYTYNQINSGTSYTLGYTLEKPVNEFAAGAAIAFPGNINNQCIPNCTGKYCGDSDGCSGKCTAVPTLSSGSLTCDSSTYQLKCGSTIVANYAKINQCSVNTATCSGATCTGAQVCVSGACKNSCTVATEVTDCGYCGECVNGACQNQPLGQDKNNKCPDPITNDSATGCRNGGCDGNGSCIANYNDTSRHNCPLNYNCSGGYCCNATCGGANGKCPGQQVCGITCNMACTDCCNPSNNCSTKITFDSYGQGATCGDGPNSTKILYSSRCDGTSYDNLSCGSYCAITATQNITCGGGGGGIKTTISCCKNN